MPRKKYDRLIVWFRRDLRVEDNLPLHQACLDSDQIIPVFVFDDGILARPDTGAARVIFILDALNVLDKNLQRIGGRLIVRRGPADTELVKACEEYGAQGVYFQEEYEPYGRERDRKAREALEPAGKMFSCFPGLTVVEPAKLLSQAGTPYTVFSPYKRVWFDRPLQSPVGKPSKIAVPQEIGSLKLPSADEIGYRTDQKFDCGGEDAALHLLQRFVKEGLAEYETKRDALSADGTSKLSRHLHFGTISVRKIVDTVRGRPGSEPFIAEIAWRDFYMQILYHFPYVEHGPFKRQFGSIAWDDDQKKFDAWCKGRTGYPVVDAAMRQLNQEAWMHNRARMIVASFLTKDLLINWQKGERYFMQKLVDGDLAANNGGWQWAAGTGTDAQPYFRIFNPEAQGEKFDPNGEYVRRYVPELTKIPNKVIHSPWKLSKKEQEFCGCVLGEDYPLPVVDHATQRIEAIKRYQLVGGQN
jgi:deoxyribodipyrimidine photo-lyase